MYPAVSLLSPHCDCVKYTLGSAVVNDVFVMGARTPIEQDQVTVLPNPSAVAKRRATFKRAILRVHELKCFVRVGVRPLSGQLRCLVLLGRKLEV